MKKLLRAAFILILAFMFIVPAYAADTESQSSFSSDSVMKPMFTTISAMSAGLGIDSWGLATCSGSVSPSGSTYTAYLTVSLQKQSGSTWLTLSSWDASGVGLIGASLQSNYYIEHGTYRVCSAAFIYSAQGALLESALVYSPIRTY